MYQPTNAHKASHPTKKLISSQIILIWRTLEENSKLNWTYTGHIIEHLIFPLIQSAIR